MVTVEVSRFKFSTAELVRSLLLCPDTLQGDFSLAAGCSKRRASLSRVVELLLLPHFLGVLSPIGVLLKIREIGTPPRIAF